MSTKIYYYKNPKSENYKTLDSLTALKNHIRARTRSHRALHFELLKIPEYRKIINSDKKDHQVSDIRAVSYAINYMINKLSPIYEHDVSSKETMEIKLVMESDNKTWRCDYA